MRKIEGIKWKNGLGGTKIMLIPLFEEIALITTDKQVL